MKETALHVLHAEDNAGDVRLLRQMFSKESPDSFKLTHLLRMAEAEIHLAKEGVEIALLDLGLPCGHGLGSVRRGHDLVTRQGGQTWADSGLGEGATFSATYPMFLLTNLLTPAFGKERQTEVPITLVMTETVRRLAGLR